MSKKKAERTFMDEFINTDAFDKLMVMRLKEGLEYHMDYLMQTKTAGQVVVRAYSLDYEEELQQLKKQIKAFKAMIRYYGTRGEDYDIEE